MAEKQNVSDEEAAVRDLIEAWAGPYGGRTTKKSPKPRRRFRDVRCFAAVQECWARRLQENLGRLLFVVERSGSNLIQEMDVRWPRCRVCFCEHALRGTWIRRPA